MLLAESHLNPVTFSMTDEQKTDLVNLATRSLNEGLRNSMEKFIQTRLNFSNKDSGPGDPTYNGLVAEFFAAAFSRRSASGVGVKTDLAIVLGGTTSLGRLPLLPLSRLEKADHSRDFGVQVAVNNLLVEMNAMALNNLLRDSKDLVHIRAVLLKVYQITDTLNEAIINRERQGVYETPPPAQVSLATIRERKDKLVSAVENYKAIRAPLNLVKVELEALREYVGGD